MEYVDSLDLFGVEVKEISCARGSGAPTTSTTGAVGLLYMDTNTGDMYKCTAVNGETYTWFPVGGGSNDTVEDLTDSIVYNHSDKYTIQLQSCYRVGKVCMFTVQLNVTEEITDNYAFTLLTLPITPVSRVWINNATKFFMDNRPAGAVRVNDERIKVGNYLLTGFFIIAE